MGILTAISTSMVNLGNATLSWRCWQLARGIQSKSFLIRGDRALPPRSGVTDRCREWVEGVASRRPFQVPEAGDGFIGNNRHLMRCFSVASTKSVEPGTSLTTREAALAVKHQNAGLVGFYSDHHVVPLPEGHRFPMDKYKATRKLLEEDAALKGILATYPAPYASREELSLVHDASYLDSLSTGDLDEKQQRALGFPWSLDLWRRSMASCGGTVAAMHAVMLGVSKVAANMAGGTHHAFPDHGEGFCVYNDIAVAAKVALKEYPVSCNLQSPILVIDLDVHQGNGTSKIFENDDRVITFDLHGAKNYPWRTRMTSNYDIGLPDATEDEEYLRVLNEHLPSVFDKHNPFLVFFQAGVDALKEDSFGRLALTRQGLLRRNHIVYSACMTRNLPLVITMGGGYSRPSEASIQAHADVYRSAALRYGAVQSI
ncbi:hypothetical protein R1sor_007873 [Riccia sorocarpa]|uniref:Histone deacetylase domain-containing protein n=1 Tax=Riccia sorocarpa TaxID=122646 RepID=A0ABD3HUK5_9MARC